jgi:hypothetical protein
VFSASLIASATKTYVFLLNLGCDISVTVLKYNTEHKYKRIVFHYAQGVNMHKAIFSEREREMLNKYLTEDTTSETFRTLRMLIKRNYQQISEDFKLLKKAQEKINLTGRTDCK